jgi:hypothetical protein
MWRKLRCGGCFERRCGEKLGAAVLQGTAKSWVLRCGGTSVRRNGVKRMMLVRRELRWPHLVRPALRCCGTADAAVLRNFGAAVVDRRAVAFGLHPCPFSRGPRANRHCGQRSCNQLSSKLAADCDGGGDFRDESFGGPVFSGVRDGNVARCRSWLMTI